MVCHTFVTNYGLLYGFSWGKWAICTGCPIKVAPFIGQPEDMGVMDSEITKFSVEKNKNSSTLFGLLFRDKFFSLEIIRDTRRFNRR